MPIKLKPISVFAQKGTSAPLEMSFFNWEMGPLATKAAIRSPRLPGICRHVPHLGWPWVPLPLTGEGVPGKAGLSNTGLLNNAEAVSSVCTILASSLPQSSSPRLAQGASSWPVVFAFLSVPSPAPLLPSCFWLGGACASPSVQPHMLPARVAKSGPVLSDSTPAWAASLRPSLPNLVARKQPGCRAGAGPWCDGVAGPWPLAEDTRWASRPDFFRNWPWSGPRFLEKHRRLRPSRAGESHSLWIYRPQGRDPFQKNLDLEDKGKDVLSFFVPFANL